MITTYCRILTYRWGSSYFAPPILVASRFELNDAGGELFYLCFHRREAPLLRYDLLLHKGAHCIDYACGLVFDACSHGGGLNS
jgi:hypothetical protein